MTITRATVAEADTIAACLVDEDAVVAIAATGIQPDDFATIKAQYAYEAIRAVSAAGERVNAITVAYELAQRGRVESVTLTWLSQIVEELPTSIGADSYARIVIECAQRRRAQAAAAAVQEAAERGTLDPEKAAALFTGVSREPAPRKSSDRRAVVPAHMAAAASARPAPTAPDFACSVRGCGREAVTYGPDEQPYCERCAPVWGESE